MTKKLFKIKSTVTNQYSKGGQWVNDAYFGKVEKPRYLHWSKKGKIWQGTGPIRCHLNQYVNWTYAKFLDGKTDWTDKKLVNNIPHTWIVEEHLVDEGVTYSYLARDFYENKNPKRI